MAVDDTTDIKAALVLGERAHIQNRVWGDVLTNMADTYRWYKIAATVPSESGNAFAVTVQLKEENGTNVTSGGTGFTYRAKLYSDNMVELATAAYTITVTGGSAVTGDAQADVIFTLAAAGTATLTVADVSTTSTDTIHMILEPLDHMGEKTYTSMTFA